MRKSTGFCGELLRCSGQCQPLRGVARAASVRVDIFSAGCAMNGMILGPALATAMSIHSRSIGALHAARRP